jgi:hypothetical protein
MVFCVLVFGLFQKIGRSLPRFINVRGGRDEGAIIEGLPGSQEEASRAPTTLFPQSSDFALAAIKLRNESHRMLAP